MLIKNSLKNAWNKFELPSLINQLFSVNSVDINFFLPCVKNCKWQETRKMEKQIMSSYYLRSMKTRSEEFSKFHKKTPELVSSFIKRRHCRCVLVNLENFDRPSFSKNTSGQLLLCCTLWECTVSSLSSKIIVPVNFFINSKIS